MIERRATSQGGNALVMVLVVAALLLAVFLVFANSTHIGTKSVVHTLVQQKARYNAESGYSAALDWLKTPASDVLSTTPFVTSSLTEGATYYLSLWRDADDVSLISVVSTGYYLTDGGPDIDPQGRRSRMAVIQAQVRVGFVKDYFAVVPGTLEVAFGSDISLGRIYGKDLIFQPPPSVGAPGVTNVEEAFYANSVTDGSQPNPAPSFVHFTGATQSAQKVSSAMNVPKASSLQNYYLALAQDTTAQCMLPVVAGVCSLAGTWVPPPTPGGVCYCKGDLHLGENGQPLSFSGNDVVFVEGTTYIMNTLQPTGATDWLAVVSQGDVTVDASAPDILIINGTYVTDGAMKMVGGARPAGQLQFHGGIVSHDGISLSGFQQSRTYGFTPADRSMKLPFLIEPVSWTLARGKY